MEKPSEPGFPQRVLGRYQLAGRIAAGAAGSVFRATDDQQRDLVVKFFDAQEDGDGFSPWLDEMRLVLRLRHRNIVRCLDIGFDQQFGLWVLVFERAQGGSLRRALAARRTFSVPETLRVLQDVAAALLHAHQAGIVHRDVKPENIVAERAVDAPTWLLTDFGSARFLRQGDTADSVQGSVQYMAPEVWQLRATASSDQYSLGVMGVELLVGKRLSVEELSSYVLQHRDASGLAGVLARLCEPCSERRFPSVDLLVHALQVLSQRGEGTRFDIVNTKAGGYLLDGESLWFSPSLEEPLVFCCRLPRGRCFLGDGRSASVPMLAAERRLALWESGALQTLFAADRPLLGLVGSTELRRAWLLSEHELQLVDATGVLAVATGAPVEQLRASLASGARPVGAIFGAQQGLVAVRGDSTAYLVWQRETMLQVTPLPLPAPLQEVYQAGSAARLLCGTATATWVLLCDAVGIVEQGHQPSSVCAVRLLADGRSETVQALR